ncbi:MAG: hypothetical protein ACREQI_05200 [Candidatus Binataceae bacterium]
MNNTNNTIKIELGRISAAAIAACAGLAPAARSRAIAEIERAGSMSYPCPSRAIEAAIRIRELPLVMCKPDAAGNRLAFDRALARFHDAIEQIVKPPRSIPEMARERAAFDAAGWNELERALLRKTLLARRVHILAVKRDEAVTEAGPITRESLREKWRPGWWPAESWASLFARDGVAA